MYSAIVMEHFAHPRNIGTLEEPSAVGCAGMPGQGPHLVLYLYVRDGRASEARYQCYGCPAVIAAGSLLTEWVAGKTLDEAGSIDADVLMRGLGGMPLGKEHAPALAVAALRDALGQLAADRGGSR